MPLARGLRLGPYEIVALLGVGGMGEVYRARDTALQRDVAIKVLPDAFASDPGRLARFEREARVLAALNHPNIAGIHGLESLDGRPALILEFVDGETLSHRWRTTAPRLDQTLRFALQIARAIEAAHERGIIHRDLKPDNVAIGGADQIKVLDFGLAKAIDAGRDDRAPDPTVTAGTRIGTVLGTAAYMSPEQARGLEVDTRADIWAFGCLLFEMLTGRRAFDGATVSDTMVAVLEREPDWNALRGAAPERIEWLVRRCLRKRPEDRLHHIADARIELEDMLTQSGPDLTGRAALAASPTAAPRSHHGALWLALSLASVAVLATVLWLQTRRPDQPAAEVRRYSAAIVLPEGLKLASNPVPPGGRFALSPDGTRLAFIASGQSGRNALWIRPLDSRVAQQLPGTEGAGYPFWSPDSRFIGFIAEGSLKTTAVSGGEVTTVCAAQFPSSGAWSADDVILFTPTGNSPLFRVPASGGTPERVTTLDASAGEVQHSYPTFLPDGRHFLHAVVGSKEGGITDPRGIYISSLDQREPMRRVLDGASNAKVANGRLVFLRGGTLLAQRFDFDRLVPMGETEAIVEQVQVAGAATTGAAGAFSVSQTGLLVYQVSGFTRSQLTWIERSGKTGGVLGEPADYGDVALSPDGAHAAVSLMDPAAGTRDIWIFDVARGIRERFTFDPGDDFGPNWMRPKGDRIVFSSRRSGGINLYTKPVAGAAGETLILRDALGKFNPHVSSDGRRLLYVAGGGIVYRSDLWTLGLEQGGKAAPFLETSAIETQGQFSPDGRSIAYMSNVSGQAEVYITSFPGREQTTRVSTAGGSWPRWNASGKEIFYLAPDNTLMVAAVNPLPGVTTGTPRALFQIRPRPMVRLDAFPYDVTADGRRFLVNSGSDDVATTLVLLINWPR